MLSVIGIKLTNKRESVAACQKNAILHFTYFKTVKYTPNYGCIVVNFDNSKNKQQLYREGQTLYSFFVSRWMSSIFCFSII